MAGGEDAAYVPVQGSDAAEAQQSSSSRSPLNRISTSLKAAKAISSTKSWLRREIFPDNLLDSIKDELPSIPAVQRSVAQFKHRVNQRPEQRQSTIQELVDSGLSLDLISAAIYARIQHNAVPNFFPHVKLDQDGGLDRLESLWDPSRYFWCVVAFGGAILNIALLLNMHSYIIHSVWLVLGRHITGGKCGWEHLWSFVVNGAAGKSTEVESMHNWEESSATGALANLVRDREWLDKILWYAIAVALAEAVAVLVAIGQGLHRTGYFWLYHNSTSSQQQYLANTQLMRFFEVTLPNMASLSALKVATFAHPSLLSNNYLDCMQERLVLGCRLPRNAFGTLLLNLWFVAKVVVCIMGATTAFAVKALLVLSKLLAPHYNNYNTYVSWIQVASLLNACVCAVTIDYHLQERMFRFIFGGSDSTYQDDERALANVYKARVVKKIWEVFWEKQGSFGRTLAMLSVMDHYSYQWLLIEDTQNQIEGHHLNDTPHAGRVFGYGFGRHTDGDVEMTRSPPPPTSSQPARA